MKILITNKKKHSSLINSCFAFLSLLSFKIKGVPLIIYHDANDGGTNKYNFTSNKTVASI